jgi:hypothetical protein
MQGAPRMEARALEELVGPITIVRGRGMGMDARRERRADGTTRMARARALVVALPHAAAPAVGAMMSERTRHAASEASATFCVLGGFLAAPVLTIMAFVGLLQSGGAPLHQAATALLLVAIVWLSLALVSAHVHHNRHHQIEE